MPLDNKSNRYFAKKYMHSNALEEDVLMEFLSWCEWGTMWNDNNADSKLLKRLQELINKYLELDFDKIKAGEQELLRQWMESSQPYYKGK